MENYLLKREKELHKSAEKMLADSELKSLLSQLGELHIAGSYTTGLMVYPDIDFSVHNSSPNFQDAVNLIPIILEKLHARELKIANFSDVTNESADYYIGFVFPYGGELWHVDATVTRPGPIITNPPELADWIQNMTTEQRRVILELKSELKAAGRYVGSRSRPPYTFRSVHLYEGVLRGGATNIGELETYFRHKISDQTVG